MQLEPFTLLTTMLARPKKATRVKMKPLVMDFSEYVLMFYLTLL